MTKHLLAAVLSLVVAGPAVAQTRLANVPVTPIAPADNLSNPLSLLSFGAYLFCWDAAGGNWDRCAGIGTDTELAAAFVLADNTANPTVPGVAAFNMCWDGATWDRCSGTSADTELPTAAALADNTANPTVPGVASFLMCWDGTTWDRCPQSSVTELTHDQAAPTWTSVVAPTLMGRASDAAPTSVGADGRPVAAWFSRDGQQHVYAQQYSEWTVAMKALSTNTGCTPSMAISAASTNATSLKASAGQIYQLTISNSNAALRYLKLYDKASAPTVGTDTPKQIYVLGTTGPPFALSFPTGMTFDLGIAWALTTGVAVSDTGAVSANEHVVNICYK